MNGTRDPDERREGAPRDPFVPFPILHTHRLRLRPIGPHDASALHALLADEETMRYYGHPPHRTLAETDAIVATIASRIARRELLRWGLTRRDDDRLIGSCSLHAFDLGRSRAETGYILHRDAWGQGLMAEALTTILDHAFGPLGLHRVEAIIDDANGRSKGLLLKLGFVYEGALRERYPVGDRFEDEHYYGLLAREWRARHG
jgi:ribosomal-protein-alanine N-acetyltransferase